MYMVKNETIRITRTEQSRIHEVDFNNIPFGRIFTDHMLVADYIDGEWQTPEIVPYGNISLVPCVTALHYGQAVFEGMKAFKNVSGDAVLFRPEDNFNRINRSAKRMCMPEVPREIFMDGLLILLDLDRQWIPDTDGSSLYIRPFMFATDEYVGIKPSDNYKLMVICCPVGPYYPKPVELLVIRDMVRAFPGGTGEAKAAGNYAGSLLGAKIAKEQGFDNVLWLDGIEQKYIEECGTMNVFFVIDGVAVTPELSGTILKGITRESAMVLLQSMGIPVEERKISIDEIVEAHRNGILDESFGAGTAATIAHVSRIGVDGEVLMLPPIEDRKVGPALLKKLTDIRLGVEPDPYGWLTKI